MASPTVVVFYPVKCYAFAEMTDREATMVDYHITPFLDFLPPSLLEQLEHRGEAVPAVPGLTMAEGLRGSFDDIQTDAALEFVCELYRRTRRHLGDVLAQRSKDRDFIDDVVERCVEQNDGRAYRSAAYQTPIGRADSDGRVVVGPRPADEQVTADEMTKVDIPDFMAGEQVTLFGPPETPKLAINAMNAWHRRPNDESALVAELVDASGTIPRWGADHEDSKTPIMADLLQACGNLRDCFDGTLSYEDPDGETVYQLADDKLSRPIKRIPGLALPDGSHLLEGNPLPLHLVDFGLHVFHNWRHSNALAFYVPKLENEEEAAYLAAMIAEAEAMLHNLHPSYEPGQIRVLVVFENPRAIFRIAEIAAALQPYFVGGSLGWHDFLASTARLFRHDPNYRIPVKADPNIVINHIKESQEILARTLTPMGAMSIGGMYGVLYEADNPASFEVSMVGYIRDVITQLKRGLDGFWVAHPDFVRPGIALVEAFRRCQQDPDDDVLERLIDALVDDPAERDRLTDFVFGQDVDGLAVDDPLYLRGVLAADIETSDVVANDDPEEIRYNIFQALQYLADWLSGNGCVALPATMKTASGDEVFVRIMDDLATTERSRWELWAEISHERVDVDKFDAILADELTFIRQNRQDATKRVQVAWDETTDRWYPIAARLLRQLVVTDDPPEFATELLLPFTFPTIRQADDPWQAAKRLCPQKYVAAP